MKQPGHLSGFSAVVVSFLTTSMGRRHQRWPIDCYVECLMSCDNMEDQDLAPYICMKDPWQLYERPGFGP